MCIEIGEKSLKKNWGILIIKWKVMSFIIWYVLILVKISLKLKQILGQKIILILDGPEYNIAQWAHMIAKVTRNS